MSTNHDLLDEDGDFAPEKVSTSRAFHDWLHKDIRAKQAATVGWSTTDEIEFVASLGTHASTNHKMSPTELRARYAAAIERRNAWGRIDPVQVRTALELLKGKD